MIPENQRVVVPYSEGETQTTYANMLKEMAGENKGCISMAFKENDSSITASFNLTYGGGSIVQRGRNTTAQPFCVVTLDGTQAYFEFPPEVVGSLNGFQYLVSIGNSGNFRRKPVQTKIVDNLYVDAVKEVGHKFGLLPVGS